MSEALFMGTYFADKNCHEAICDTASDALDSHWSRCADELLGEWPDADPVEYYVKITVEKVTDTLHEIEGGTEE